MNRLLPCLLAAALGIAACSPATSPGDASIDTAAAVRALLARQIADWNNGDVAAFMDGYWRDDAVRFASGGDVKRGWNRVLGDYERRYPDRAAMGRLQTAGVEVTELGPDSALVFGQWVVSANETDYCGLFTLVVRRIDGRWVVIHDHTSSAENFMAAGRSCSELAASR